MAARPVELFERIRRDRRVGVPLGDAVATFLDTISVANTRRGYAAACHRLVVDFGVDSAVGALDPDRLASWFASVWGHRSAKTFKALSLDVTNLGMANRCAVVIRKGGACDVIVWQTGTARLLPRMLAGRRKGPVFCTDGAAVVARQMSRRDARSTRGAE